MLIESEQGRAVFKRAATLIPMEEVEESFKFNIWIEISNVYQNNRNGEHLYLLTKALALAGQFSESSTHLDVSFILLIGVRVCVCGGRVHLILRCSNTFHKKVA